jgi:hypothetical protein
MPQTNDQFSQWLISTHDVFTHGWHDEKYQGEETTGLLLLIIKQHRQNFELWHEEDSAREPNADSNKIAQIKKKIDLLNQTRNDLISDIDVWLNQHQFPVVSNANLPWNSETIGSIIDRLSIASLKRYHMHEQSNRADIDEQQLSKRRDDLCRIQQQRDDLALALDTLIVDITAGRKQNKLYRQFKMYNDPNLNPKIYGSKRT